MGYLRFCAWKMNLFYDFRKFAWKQLENDCTQNELIYTHGCETRARVY